MTKRISNLLPEVFQTTINKKFFAATADNLFQSENVEYLNGYIGQKPGWYNSKLEYYIKELNQSRQNYQVEATAVSRNYLSGNVTNTLFYEDLLNNLKFDGSLTNDPNRLFEQEYYSFGLPIDIDKWINPQSYAWVPNGPNLITLTSSTSLNEIQLNSTYTYTGNYYFANSTTIVDGTITPLIFTSGLKLRFSEDIDTTIRDNQYIIEGVGRKIYAVKEEASPLVTYNPSAITLVDSTNILNIQQFPTYTYTGHYYYASNPSNIIDGKVTPLVFSNGMVVQFSDDYDYTIVNNLYIVSGVGNQISLTESHTSPQNYICMGRGSVNQNPWSIKNRWFHIDVLTLSKTNVEYIYSNLGKRAILEFDRNIQLWNFASKSRGFVNVVDTTTKTLTNIIGKSNYTIDGISIKDGMNVLFTNLTDPSANNLIYSVSNQSSGAIILEVVPNGTDISGAPVTGDGVTVLQGNSWYNINNYLDYYINWYYNGSSWILGQYWNPKNLNQAPLFNLYDVDGNSLNDPGVYPLSNFSGSTLFQYQTQSLGNIDPYLGSILVYEPNQPNEFVFENTLVTQQWLYQPASVQTPILGYFFWKTNDPVTGDIVYNNNWFKSKTLSRQYIVNEYVAINQQTQFLVDQKPSNISTGPSTVTVELNGKQLIPNQEFTVSDNIITLKSSANDNDNVKIRTWSENNIPVDGYFEIPKNLEANPNNLDITTTTRADLINHLISVILNQSGITGSIIGSNNWRDTSQLFELGTCILQHRAPMLKLMTLNAISQSNIITTSISQLEPMPILQWAQSEYLRFYNKFINALLSLYTSQGYTTSYTPAQWIDAALTKINIGKTSSSTWVNSGFDLTQTQISWCNISGQTNTIPGYCNSQISNPSYIPPSAARLGASPAWIPTAFYDTTQPTSPLSLRCHNGAIVVLRDFDNNDLGTIEGGLTTTNDPLSLTNPIAQAWMLFELSLFNNLPTSYSNEDALPPVDFRTIFSGKWRSVNYSYKEKIQMLTPAFDRWRTNNQVDTVKNTIYNPDDEFTWNYSKCFDFQNQPLPGYWRGIYFYYYDTDTPHLTPWEMLGFTQKPTWWDSEYGVAPYTSGNTKMWTDLSNGYIAQGNRSGYYDIWTRPGLLNCIPVDGFGDLLPPVLAGIVKTPPTALQAKEDWKFGDRAPAENVWWTTVDFDIVTAQICYLAKPAQFIEYMWDGARQVEIYKNQPNSQWIYTDTNSRKHNNQVIVHREIPKNIPTLTNTSDYYGSCGIQQWISEYLVNLNLDVTTYFGNLIRGSDVNLAYRVGGFTDATSIKLYVDSFGLTTNDTLLLPQEDIDSVLNRSGSIKEYFYSGVIVETISNQSWRVIGYDSINPFFTIIPSNKNGPKTTVSIDNASVIEYSTGKNTTQIVPYSTIFYNRQDVYDFLISHGRWQESQGWEFTQYAPIPGRNQDWSLSAREFLFWSQGQWAPGTFIALSPLAESVQFKCNFGMVQYVGTIINNSYSMLDRTGRPIKTSDVEFLRLDDKFGVTPLTKNQSIYGLRLFVTTVEHALVFGNQSVFGDTIYDPLLNQRQSRFKILSMRTLDWNGRIEAPGYVVTQSTNSNNSITNTIIPNFEKSVNDIRNLYNIDIPTQYKLSDGTSAVSKNTQNLPSSEFALSKHLTGFQSRDYLTNLKIDDVTQFKFYQGMIQQKGTSSSINSLLRSTNVLGIGESFNYYEEFAFRIGMYGANDIVHGLDIILVQDQFKSDPQLINLLSNEYNDDPHNDIITIVPNDSRIITRTQLTPTWVTRTNYGQYPGDLPTAGYALFSEVDYYVKDDNELQSLWDNQNTAGKPLIIGNVVWKFIDIVKGWDIYKIVSPVWTIVSTAPYSNGTANTTITTSTAHGLTTNSTVIITGVTIDNGPGINGTYQIYNVTTYGFDIALLTSDVGYGGIALIYSSIRFDSYSSLQSSKIPGGWEMGSIAYVDGTTTTPWSVYRLETYWLKIREEELKVDTSLMLTSRLYDKIDSTDLGYLVLFDPVKNCIPGVISEELNYITAYDPAKYNTGDTTQYKLNPDQSWGPEQIGQTWWDLSTTRYIDYESGPNSNRRQFWGQIAPGTTVDIYEWVRSLVPPSLWASAVQSSDSSATGGNFIPTGTVKNSNYPYVQTNEITPAGNYAPVYYFWVKNTTTVPSVKFRSTSTAVLSNLLTYPQKSGIQWWAPTDYTTALLGNIGPMLNGNNTVWQINYLSDKSLGIIHKHWTLIRPNDPTSYPTDRLWERMHDSLVEFDSLGNPVPDLYLPVANQVGGLIRPSQSWFINAGNARRAFVKSVNNILSSSNVAPLLDSERIGWLEYFNSDEPIPAASNIISPVVLATTTQLNAYYYNGEDGVNATLVSFNEELLTIDGVVPNLGDRILVKDGTFIESDITFNIESRNGIYEVVDIGSVSKQWVLIRSNDFSKISDNLINAQVSVTHGNTNVGSTWYQNNNELFRIGIDSIRWGNGFAPVVWNKRVANLAALYQLQGQLVPNSLVLVNANSNTNNRWTIWKWTGSTWILVRTQSWSTQNCWTYIDWYATGYNSSTLINYTFNTISDMTAYIGFVTGDIIKVTNTGNGSWNLYLYDSTTVNKYSIIGVQNGNIQLLDNLWDYKTYGYGFDGGNFDVDYQGFEYDTRLELDQIIKGLWVNPSQTGLGLLKSDASTNEYNKVFFDMIYYILQEQPFVDWIFKTSFLTLRGFATELMATSYYPEDIISYISAYINEIKPYHVNVRQFIDYRTTLDTWNDFSTDFDRPPYVAGNNQVRILDSTDPIDSTILTTNNLYIPWSSNYKTTIYDGSFVGDGVTTIFKLDTSPIGNYTVVTINGIATTDYIVPPNLRTLLVFNTPPISGSIIQVTISTPGSLIRNVSTSMIFDRVSCSASTSDWYETGFSSTTSVNFTVDTVSEMKLLTGLSNGDLIKVNNLYKLVWGIFQYESGSFNLVGQQQSNGTADRISLYYQPTGDMPTINSPLISGCEAKGLILEGGNSFVNVGEWGEPIWDDPNGWDYTEQPFEQFYDLGINGGQLPRWFSFKGDGINTEFELPWAPQNPSEMTVVVDLVKLTTPTDWTIPNFVTNVSITNPGSGYSVNDVLTIAVGSATTFATIKVMSVSGTGSILSVELVLPGSYTFVPRIINIPVTGGTGTNAVVATRWGGSTIKFTNPPAIAGATKNIWISEKGSTFVPSFGAAFDTIFDGAGLSRPNIEANHPEELFPLLTRDSLLIDTYSTASGGFGNILTQTYTTDGVLTNFLIGQPISSTNELMVSLNGKLLELTTDYTVDVLNNIVIFSIPPVAGELNICSIGFGGATYGLSDWSIINSGNNYSIGDTIVLNSGATTISSASVQVSAIFATYVSIISGGTNYNIGDRIFIESGFGSQPLTLSVTSVVNGVIQQIDILNNGYYTEPVNTPYKWTTDGNGSSASFLVNWGVAQIVAVNRGEYLSSPSNMTQLSTTGSGTGFELLTRNTYVKETETFVGDGTTYIINLKTTDIQSDSILVALNGIPTQNYTLLQNGNITQIGLNFVPSIGDVVIVTVYNSSLYSLQQRQDLTMDTTILTYALTYPPKNSVNQTLNSLVFSNGIKLLGGIDYDITGNNIVFTGSNITTGDKISIITWPEDSTASFVSDTYIGNSSGIYPFTQTPPEFTSVRVWANGILLNSVTDYQIKKIDNTWNVNILSTVYGISDTIELYYPTMNMSKPEIAWRTFQNIYGDVQSLRLNNTTLTSIDVNYDDTEIYIQDGSLLSIPTDKTPGVVWIEKERIEYYKLTPSPTVTYPNQVILGELKRGSLGTPSGIPDKFLTQFWIGTGSRILFNITVVDTITTGMQVTIDGLVKIFNVDYFFTNNPYGVASGLYLEFASHNIPSNGSSIKLSVFQSDWKTSKISHLAGSIVRDGSRKQAIPGGYQWPYGDQGLQYSNAYQTKFLLEQ